MEEKTRNLEWKTSFLEVLSLDICLAILALTKQSTSSLYKSPES
jgi:uncharacterized protein YpmS